MALTKKDIDVITNIISDLTNSYSNSDSNADLKKISEYINEMVHPLDNQIIEQLLKAIDKQVEINTNVHNELKILLNTLTELNKRFSNGLGGTIKNIDNKINLVYTDIVTKEGYIPKAINKLTFMWLPLIGILAAVISKYFI